MCLIQKGRKEDGNCTITDTYTNNIFGASNDNDKIKRRKEEIGGIWKVKDLEEMEYFLLNELATM